jgi:hypothetical protein
MKARMPGLDFLLRPAPTYGRQVHAQDFFQSSFFVG